MSKRVAFLTGSATGLGARTAKELAKSGMNIVINYRASEDQANALVQELAQDYGVQAIALQGDVASWKDCENMVHQAMNFFGRIDVLVHNAGPYHRPRTKIVDYDIPTWHSMIEANLNGVFYLCKLIVPQMRARKWGRIITFGFDRVETAPSWVYRGPYASAKVGLASFTRTLAVEEAPQGITVNMVCPGDIIGDAKEADIAADVNTIDTETPVGRSGTGEDIARVIHFLCDERSSFITGAIIPVTGGKDVLGKYRLLEEDSGTVI